MAATATPTTSTPHTVTVAAVAAAGGAEYPGEAWTVPKLYWTVDGESPRSPRGSTRSRMWPPDWIRVSIDDLPFGYPDDAIDAVMEVADQLPAKVAALRAHASQVTVAANGRSCALSNNFALPIGAVEHYVPGGGAKPGRGATTAGGKTDLLAGLNLE